MNDAFSKCHPAVNFLYFAAVITGTLVFQHPIFLLISACCAFVYSILRNSWRALIFDLALLPLIAVFVWYYCSFAHFGVTVLSVNLVDNNMTLEALVYGFVLGISAASVCIWFSCLNSVITADKVVYLFGRFSPRLSLFLAIALRMVPRIKQQAKKLNTAQSGIGRGIRQGNLLQRLQNGMRILSMLITWGIDTLTAVSDAMRCRGSSLRGRKAFSIYRFDNRDRAYVIGMFLCLTLTLMGVLLQQTDAQYDPRIIIPPVTALSWLFFAGYACLCLMPVALELWTDYRFKKARKSVSGHVYGTGGLH